jgi:AsmA protein
LPAKEIAAQLAGSAAANLKKEQAQLNVSGTVDQSKLQGRFGVTGFAKPAISFDAEMDQLNLNRYMAADAKKPAAEKSQTEKPAKPGQGEPEKPFDLSALKDLNANGTLKIGSLTAADLKASQVILTLKAANGKVQLDPLAANLYQGRMTGAASVNAASTPMFTLKQNLNGIAVGPLLKDIAEKDLLEGKGNVSLDLAAQGATVSAIKQSLNGTAALKLEDGALNGINIAQSIRSARAQLKALRGEAAPASTGPQKTDFSELSASFAIKNGIAHNDDLSIKSPLLRIGGSGDVNIPAEKLDYLMKATVVATSKGQGGAELEALKGLTVPVKIFGPLDSPEYKLDLSGVATQAAQQKLEEKKEELKARAQEKIQERLFGKQGQDAQKKEGSEQKLQDALKGIFK